MNILLAEDDPDTRQFVEDALGEMGHRVMATASGAQTLEWARDSGADILVLDRMLPDMDGIAVLRALRGGGLGMPVLMLTALGRIEDRVDGLDAGADDYLVKPFAISELVARINALTRRTAPVDTGPAYGGIMLDLRTRQVTREGRVILLQPREFRLLEELVRAGGGFLTRTMLLERVWDFHFDPQTKIVETHMSRLRSKLNEGFAEDAIETVRGMGYRVRGS
ncbi:response regulator transcription factor [Novosphingobium humi]|uniref:response regulator transcription factor n=1 Tax=Novosphingobium humi TaxID=2282397 RepID=UPI0025B17546|nr:response regulator transcription factor [Novosphingobium humi]WJS99764.1 response regulator transcription factor [Novosphingobium humi]